MTEILTAEHFLPHVKRAFHVKGGRHDLTLLQVETLGSKTNGVPRQPFSLIFSGAPDDVLPEGLYTLEIAGGAQFELYVIPVHTPLPGRQNYQAVFN